MIPRLLPALLLSVILFTGSGLAQQAGGQEDKILERGSKLLEEAKAAYEDARNRNSVSAFVDAGFKLEESRIKFIVLQEIGTPEHQKLAMDRLRDINQLGKLIHDGKVAISGSGDKAVPSKPDVSIPKARPGEAPPKLEGGPGRVAPDVTKRIPVPDDARLREAEKLVKDIFQDQYSNKSPLGRMTLAKDLLEESRKSAADPAALWILYREATDAAVQGGDVRLAIQTIETAARFFDVDVMSMKNAALMAASKVARNPWEFAVVAEGLLALVEEYIAADQYETADKLVNAAVLSARRSNDPGLAFRATTRSKEVAEATTRFQAMRAVLETLAKASDDANANLEMGQFLCFVKGSWDLGLRFLLKGSDEALRGLAQKELAFPPQAAELVSIADGWWALAQKEKSTLRKGQMLSHAGTLYETASLSASGLLLSKIDKRLADIQAAGGPLTEINLIALIDLPKDKVVGEWAMDGGRLYCVEKVPFARIQIPYIPPEEYDVLAVVTRTENNECLQIGLVRGGAQFQAGFDSWGGLMSGLNILDGKMLPESETCSRKTLFANDQPSTVICSVRKEGVKLTVDGRVVLDWKSTTGKLTNDPLWTVPNPKALYIGCWSSKYVISKLALTPVTGRGKRLR
jgi:hypothetical protein